MFDVFIMDMGGHDDNVKSLAQRFPHAKVVRYYDNHLDTLKRCISRCRTPYAWVISSCCDYTDFDFDYRPIHHQAYQIHCWASGSQQFGDTFLVPKDEFLKQQDIELLEWYKDINWHDNGVPRLEWPVLECETEDITQHLKDCEFDSSYVWVNQRTDYDPLLWKDRCFHSFNKSGDVSLAPREIQTHLSTQIYDYPHLIKQKDAFLPSKPLDIIYISNGETNSEQWYEHCQSTVEQTVKRVRDVKGRDLAIKQAAYLSDTPWFYAVWAKLEIDPNFDWTWQPDCLQQPKHYIFHATNPINGLQYGHMAMVAYNRELVLETRKWGLDFTMSKLHGVVPVVSGTAHYNSDPLMTWRTAFREVIKLKQDSETGNIESLHRLQVWLTKAQGENSEWSLRGAKDAVEYYDSVNGIFNKLMLSFDWDWLKNYHDKLYFQSV